jgi:hypothetical protein
MATALLVKHLVWVPTMPSVEAQAVALRQAARMACSGGRVAALPTTFRAAQVAVQFQVKEMTAEATLVG